MKVVQTIKDNYSIHVNFFSLFLVSFYLTPTDEYLIPNLVSNFKYYKIWSRENTHELKKNQVIKLFVPRKYRLNKNYMKEKKNYEKIILDFYLIGMITVLTKLKAHLHTLASNGQQIRERNSVATNLRC